MSRRKGIVMKRNDLDSNKDYEQIGTTQRKKKTSEENKSKEEPTTTKPKPKPKPKKTVSTPPEPFKDKTIEEILERLETTDYIPDGEIIAVFLEYIVSKLNEEWVYKEPRAGHGFKVLSHYQTFQALKDTHLIPETHYIKRHNALVQEFIKGGIAGEEDLKIVREKVKDAGYTARGLLERDVIVAKNDQLFLVDVGSFEQTPTHPSNKEKKNG